MEEITVGHNQSAVNHGRRQQILEAFRDADDDVLTTAEIHEKVGGVSRETIRSDLKKMRGSELEGRETNQDYVWWVDQSAVSSEGADEGVATGEQLRGALVDLMMERLDFRVLFVALLLLAVTSFLGAGIYLMLQFDYWLLPISQTRAIVYTYAPMVTFGIVIAVAGLIVLFRER